MARKRYNLNLDPELVRQVDEARGDVSRSRWAERAFEMALGFTPKLVLKPTPVLDGDVLRTVEEASGGAQSPGDEADVPSGEMVRPSRLAGPTSPRPSQTYKCPAGHPFPKPPTSPSARCPACSRVVVPA